MAKNKNNQSKKDRKPLPKADVEFGGENGLEDIALKALKSQNKSHILIYKKSLLKE
jgi:hypothetical protein